jgi:hypothetical protein
LVSLVDLGGALQQTQQGAGKRLSFPWAAELESAGQNGNQQFKKSSFSHWLVNHVGKNKEIESIDKPLS